MSLLRSWSKIGRRVYKYATPNGAKSNPFCDGAVAFVSVLTLKEQTYEQSTC